LGFEVWGLGFGVGDLPGTSRSRYVRYLERPTASS